MHHPDLTFALAIDTTRGRLRRADRRRALGTRRPRARRGAQPAGTVDERSTTGAAAPTGPPAPATVGR